MKIIGLDDREYSFVPSNNQSKVSSRSKLHEKAYKTIRERYPFSNILQEVSLPGSKTRINSTLQADFFLPIEKVVIEVHGEQHYKFNTHFYNSKRDFLRAQGRDRNKEKWCEKNGITHVALAYNETEEEWKEKLC